MQHLEAALRTQVGCVCFVLVSVDSTSTTPIVAQDAQARYRLGSDPCAINPTPGATGVLCEGVRKGKYSAWCGHDESVDLERST